MRTCVLAILVVVGLATGVSAEVIPQKKWLQVRSAHFTVMGEASVRDLRNVAERMEQLHEALGQIAKLPESGASEATVVVFKDARSFRPFQPRYEDKPVAVAGYFQPGPMNYISILADRDYDYSQVIYHEYVHMAVGRALGAMPPWMSEGLAEFFGAFDVERGGKVARIGTVPAQHVDQLRRQFLPLATLTSVRRDSPYYNERDKSSVFYAESWALVHFLYVGKDGKYRARLGTFFDAVLNGTSIDRACQEQLGVALAVLEEELRQYVYMPVLYRLNVPLPDVVERIARLEATPVPEATAHAVLAQLLFGIEQDADAREHLTHALAVDARQPLAAARLAALPADPSGEAETRALLQKASEGSGVTYESHYYRALALERLQASDEEIVAAWQDAVALNNTFGEGYARLAQARANTGTGLEQAFQWQQRAIQLEPARDEYRLGLARLLIMRGDTKTARNLLGLLVARSSQPAIAKSARNYLAVAAQVENARTNGTEAPKPPEPPGAATGTPTAPPPGIDPARATSVERPDLRPLAAGEAQIFGRLTTIECGAEGVTLVADTAQGPVRVRGTRLSQLELVSFRADLRGSIECGPFPQTPPVLITYKPGATDDSVGTIVVVEFVPIGFTPPRQ